MDGGEGEGEQRSWWRGGQERRRTRPPGEAHRKGVREQGGAVHRHQPDRPPPEIVERPDHPCFAGVQLHPEGKSKLFDPHPLFASFTRGGQAVRSV